MGSELIVERRTPLPVSPEEAFAWHARPGAIDRLIPPWRKVKVLERERSLVDGSRTRLSIQAGPFVVGLVAEHCEVEPGRGFRDVQVSGPFDRWSHQHRFESAPGGGAILHDRIVLELPTGLRIGRASLKRELERDLRYRHAVTAGDLGMHATANGTRLHVAITGASGLIGSLLIPALTTGGHRVTRLVRHHPPREGELFWDPAGAGLDPATFRGVDAIVHLAGANVGTRWTASVKRNIMESRRTGTRLLVQAMAQASGGPGILISASAIGFYGARGEEILTEASPAGTGFFPEVVREWERATEPAEAAGIRVVRLRIAPVLTPAGGSLQRMLLPFRLGIGGRLGHGDQWMSWISPDDLIGAFHRALTDQSLRGPVNAVAPEPVRNRQFTRELAGVLGRPAPFVVPAAALRLRFGQMADEAILASARVVPERLEASGYRFRQPTLAAALAHVLGKQ